MNIRPLLTLVITGLLLGGIYNYTRFAASVRPVAEAYQTEFTSEVYTVEIDRTFMAAAPTQPPSDASANLDNANESESEATTASLQVRFKGVPILIRRDEIPPDEVLEISALPDVEVGLNELFVSANQSQPAQGLLAAMQVRVKRGSMTIAESTLSSVPGSALIYGVVVFSASSMKDPDDHDE